MAGFFSLWYVEMYADIAWPWYCPLGGAVSIVVGWGASILLDGFKTGYHPYTIHGQKELFVREGRAEMQDGWYVVPGKVDKSSYLLLLFFCLCIAALWVFKVII